MARTRADLLRILEELNKHRITYVPGTRWDRTVKVEDAVYRLAENREPAFDQRSGRMSVILHLFAHGSVDRLSLVEVSRIRVIADGPVRLVGCFSGAFESAKLSGVIPGRYKLSFELID